MKQLIFLIGTGIILGAGCTNQPPARQPGAQAQAEPSQPDAESTGVEEGAPDINDPETLARAVFEALRKGDAELYLEQNVHSPQDFIDASKLTGDSSVPAEAELDALHKKIKQRFTEYLALLKEKGLDPGQAEIKDILTDEAVIKDGMGFAEDLTLVLQQGDTVINVTIDDVMLSSRGWLILDGLKLRE